MTLRTREADVPFPGTGGHELTTAVQKYGRSEAEVRQMQQQAFETGGPALQRELKEALLAGEESVGQALFS